MPGLYLALDAGMTEVLSQILPDLAGLLVIPGMPETMDLAPGISPERLSMIEAGAKTAVLGRTPLVPPPKPQVAARSQ